MKPLEIKDFSGGQTDNFFQGEPTRAERLYNLLIGIDHKLFSRNGSLATTNTRKSARINYIQNFNALTDLVYASAGHFYDLGGTEVLGPSGNIAFVGATAEAMYTSSETQDHLFVAVDEKLQPEKFYRNSTGALQVRTVGLPKVANTPISDATLLAECIAAANLLRTRFLNHINSAENTNSERDGTSTNYLFTTQQPPTSIKAHWSVDKYAKYYFDGAITFTAGQWRPNGVADATVNPSPAVAATDYTSLVHLISALNFAFEEHREDSAGFASIEDSGFSNLVFGPNRYHALGYQTQFTDGITNFGLPTGSGFIEPYAKPFNQGLQQRIVENYNPESAINASIPESEVYRTKLIAIAKFLDDFAVKFCLHEVAPFVHRYNFQNSQLVVPQNVLVNAAFAHQFLEPLLSTQPVVIPTPFNFIYASNFVQRAFKNHALNTDTASGQDPTYPTLHTERNDSIVSGLQPAGFYFATLPPTPTIRQQYSAFRWDVVAAKISIFTARYAYWVHTIDLQIGAQSSRVDQTASGGVPGAYTIHLITNPGGINYIAGAPGMAVISNRYSRTSNKIPRQQSFNGITSNDGAGNYHVCFDATGFTYTNFSIGSFIMHPYPMTSGNTSFANYTGEIQYLKSFGYAPDIYDLAGWVPLMSGFYAVFKAHVSAVDTHYDIETAHLEFSPSDIDTGLPAGGVQYFLLSSLLPSVDLPGTQPLFITPDVKSYSYAWTYSDTYTAQSGITYKVESAPVLSPAFNSEETYAVGVVRPMMGEPTISLINQIITPVAMVLGAEDLTNTATTNYAITLLNTYRTTGNGDSYFKINMLPATPLVSLSWPTITLLGAYDLVSDVNGNIALNDSEDILYTDGGVSASNQPPKCKYTWAANDYVYYGGVYEGDTFLPNRVLQSVQLAGDWVPSTNSIDFASPVVGGGSARNVNVCFTEKGVFRLEGAFGKDGSGAITKQQISNEVGGISGSSIVVTEIGLFFAGSNGFYYTDGYQCIRISQELFRAFPIATNIASQKRALKGVYDRTYRRIYWTVRSTSSQTDNDIIFAYDLNFGVTPSGAFSTLFGATGSWNPSALGFLGNVCYIGDTDGYLYHFDENTKTDPLKNTAIASSTWATTYIPWEWRSTMMDFGGTAMRKFFSRIHHVGKNRGDVAIQYYITADNLVTQNLAPMRFIDTGGTGVVDQWRRVGGKKLRADLYQIGVTNGRFTVYNSDDLGGTPVFVSHVGTDTTIDMLNTHIPLDSVGMSLCFASNYYATEFVIKSVVIAGADSTLVLSDPLNKVNGLLSLEWEIRGFMKDQAFSLDALTIWYEEQGNLGTQYLGYGNAQGGGGNK